MVEHKEKVDPDGFTTRYQFDTADLAAIGARMREVEIKGWRREKKLKLILEDNPDWADLSQQWQENPGWALEPGAQWRIKRKTGGL